VRDIAKGLNNLMPDDIRNLNKKFDEYVRGMATGGTLFEELGFYYVGPVDAHDLDNLIPILENIRYVRTLVTHSLNSLLLHSLYCIVETMCPTPNQCCSTSR
jgi:1-deoxy-D-xylulose-5-phosphate synthase